MNKENLLTADYDMCYYDLIMLIDDFFPDGGLNENQKNLLLSALVGNYDPLDAQAIPKAFSIQTFWEEQTDKSAQAIVMKKNYITINGRLLFLLSVIGSGVMTLVLDQCSSGVPLNGVFIAGAAAASANCVVALYSWLKSIEKLEDDDFCVYMQALTHFHQYKEFSMQDLISWFPECGKVCNMHNSKWDCDFLCKKTDNCMIKLVKDERTGEFIETNHFIEESIKALIKKGLLVRDKVYGLDDEEIAPDEKYRFHFVH